MSISGDADLLVLSRSVLLDALEALVEHRCSVIVVGAQAIYLHTGTIEIALAEATKDSDVALDPRTLGTDPLIDEAMARAGFVPNPETRQPGSWVNAQHVPVDLMVPEALAGGAGRRAARIPPHGRYATRRAVGLEAAMVDRAPMAIRALDPMDPRVVEALVAGPAALLVAKLHKLGERLDQPDRLNDKDAHDIYRLLYAVPTDVLRVSCAGLLQDPIAEVVTRQALAYLQDLFADSPAALGSTMAGRSEELVGDPDVVAASVATLAEDLLMALAR